jgi:CRISPR system Cascade subunit CasA
LQTGAPSGGAGHRTSLRGGGPLTTLVFPGTKDSAGPNLWQRLWANVPDAVDDDDRASLADAPLIFSWLGKTRISDKTGTATTPSDVHPAQAFFGMPRRVQLNFTANIAHQPCDLLGIVDDVIVTSFVTRPWGTHYTAWSRRHPLSPYYRPKKTDSEFLPVHLKSSRVGYRQWLGMVMEAQEGMRVPAKCFDIWRKRAADFEGDDAVVKHNARLMVAGYSMDKMKPLDFAEALLPLIVTGDGESDKAMKQIASDWVNGADDVANQLVSAVKRALYGEKGKVERDSTVLDAVKSRFWAQTERDFYAKLRTVADRTEAHRHDLTNQLYIIKESEGVEWLKALRHDALDIFDATVPIESADGDRIGDVIAGRKMLGLMLSGYGKGGSDLFDKLGQARVETKKGSKAA